MGRKGKEREEEREEGEYGRVTSEKREGGKEKHGEKSFGARWQPVVIEARE